jgi:hypothetical protein
MKLKDLIDLDIIHAPTKVFGFYLGSKFEARLNSDGTISYRGKHYASPSVAAGHVIATKFGIRTPGRPYFSVNGWIYWHVVCADGKSRRLRELRERHLRRRNKKLSHGS